jgi:phage N-6-adenine-methyltransferase
MLLGFKAANHPQQVGRSGTRYDIDDRATDPTLFAALDQRFRFSIDVAAAPHNTRCARFFDRLSDGLGQSWAGERIWCNPPYSAISPWVEKAWAEHPQAPLIVMLLPANRTEQAWWQDMVEPYRDRPGSPLSIEFLRGRLRFVKAGQTSIGPNERPPFGCCLLIWGAERAPAPAYSPGQLSIYGEVDRVSNHGEDRPDG